MIFTHPVSLFYYAPAWVGKTALKAKFKHSWVQIPEDANYLFIHIPKTGGSSLGMRLYGDYINHVSAKVHYLLDASRFEKMYSFSVLRHPAERFISAINHCIGNSRRAGAEDLAFGKQLLEEGSDALSIAEVLCVSSNNLIRICGSSLVFVPQSHWVCDRDNVMVNKLFALKEGRSYLSKNASNGIVENVSRDESTWKSLSSSTLGVIREVYRRDWVLYDEALAKNSITDVTQIINVDELLIA